MEQKVTDGQKTKRETTMLRKCIYLPRLETGRLILRELERKDAEDLKEWIAGDELYTYWGRPINEDEKNPDLFFEDPAPGKRHRRTSDLIWWIELKSTGKVIGEIEVYDVKDNRFGMLGYRIDPRLWNTGVCTEAIRRVTEYIFGETDFDRLQANVDIRNTASNRALKKCGFTLEGTIRHGKMVSVYCDYNIWGMIRDDVESLKGRE